VTAPGPRSPIVRVFDCHIVRQSPSGSLEYLLLKRAFGKLYEGTWRMVGGKLKPEETAWQACLRELSEETQLRPLKLFVVPYLNRFYEWQHDRINDIPVFVVTVPPGSDPVLDAEHSSWLWASEAEALARLSWPGQREGLRAAGVLLQTDSQLVDFLEVPIPTGITPPISQHA
jgi:dihydroneopterin triphosphate diphosphatase